MRRGLEGKVRRWGACGVRLELGLPVRQRDPQADEGLGRDRSSPAGAPSPDASLRRQCGVSSCFYVCPVPTRSCHSLGVEPPWLPPLQGPLLPVSPLWGPPAWKAVHPSFPTQ